LKTDGVWWGAVDTQRVGAFMKKVIELRASLTA
jgi:predicted TIM-barrel enzyme